MEHKIEIFCTLTDSNDNQATYKQIYLDEGTIRFFLEAPDRDEFLANFFSLSACTEVSSDDAFDMEEVVHEDISLFFNGVEESKISYDYN